MKTILFILLQVTLASGILYGYYHLVLRNKKFHQYNRFYLLASIVISLFIPFLNIPVYFAEKEMQSSVVLQTLQTISSPGYENEVATAPIVTPDSTFFDWNILLYALYGFIAIFLLIRIFISLKKIKAIIKNNPVEDLDGIRFVNTIEPGTPYSFFRWLFWNRKIELRSAKGEQIFRHEIFHIQQKHSLDIVFMELLTAICWVNPFFYLMKKEIKAIHEFLADEFASHKTDKWAYAELLLMQALNTKQHLVNPFFHNQVKRRIAMITNPEKTSHRYLRKLLVLPVTAMVLILFAFKYKNEDAAISETTRPITIVVDAGHGGNDPGVRSNDGKYTEADLTLEIAQKIRKMGKEYNVNVLMTRSDGDLPGGARNKEDGLRNRVSITEKAMPSAFVSIHLNTDGGSSNSKTGFEVFVSGKKEASASVMLASAILQNISSNYLVKTEPMRRPEGIFVLDNINYPSVLVECGYISNAADMDFINKEENQEKIARNILEAVVRFNGLVADKINTSFQDTVPPAKDINNVANELSSKALVVIDGKEMGKMKKDDLNKNVKPGDIVAVYVWKGKTAIDKFGDKGKDGVIEITTNKENPVKIKEVTVTDAQRSADGDKIFEKVDTEPSFPGGDVAWRKFLERNLHSTIPIQNHAPVGTYTVYVEFVVNKDGSISNVRPLTNHGFGMEPEAIRIIRKGPWWVPAMQNGNKVNAYKKQRVDFVVGQNTRPISTSQPVSTSPTSASKPTDGPKIRLSDLRKATVYDLLQLDPSTDVVSFTFAIDNIKKGFIESKNTGNRFSEQTNELVRQAVSGNLITVEDVRVKKDNVEKRLPSRFYFVVD